MDRIITRKVKPSPTHSLPSSPITLILSVSGEPLLTCYTISTAVQRLHISAVLPPFPDSPPIDASVLPPLQPGDRRWPAVDFRFYLEGDVAGGLQAAADPPLQPGGRRLPAGGARFLYLAGSGGMA
jgi:hypothetical protein